MKFGPHPISEAEGVILAHTFRGEGLTLKKGHVLTAADISALRATGVQDVIGARLEPGDVSENVAAQRIAARLVGFGVQLSAARTGRCNLVAVTDGIAAIDTAIIDAANLVSEAVTIATLADKAAATAGQVVATVKIIPFAVSAETMAQVEAALSKPAVGLASYKAKRFALIATTAPGLKPSVIESTGTITRQRIAAIGGSVISATTCAHAAADVMRETKAALGHGAEIILISGASATVDRGDVVPAGIVAAGGAIDHFGMPVDPGNLLVLAHIGDVSVLVMPGCARSPKLNGVDWVMQRLAAGVEVKPQDIMRLGAGGLLVDTPSRPLPRESAVQPEEQAKSLKGKRIAALVLAAGQSRRMGGANKLLMNVDGEPLIRRTVTAVIEAGVAPVVVVTGHMADDVRQSLAGLNVAFIHNPQYADGLSTSLRAGLDKLPADIEGALICLGDMPAITAAHLDVLLSGFDPAAGKAIGVPTHLGKRGNPVLWARRFFPEMRAVSGDVGARHLIGDNESLVYEVEFGDTAVLTDLDTPAQWTDYLSNKST